MWRDLGRDLFRQLGTWVLGVVLGLLPPAAVIKTYGLQFITNQHQVSGWVILLVITLTGPMLLVGIVYSYRHRRSSRGVQTLSAVPEGYPHSLHWNLGKQGEEPIMFVVGDFVITNSSQNHLIVPRTTLVLSYTPMRFPRRQIVGPGVWEPIPARAARKDRLMWTVERPILRNGKTLKARVCFIDQFNREYWTPWLSWVAQG